MDYRPNRGRDWTLNEAMTNYFETVFTQELLLDEALDPNTKLTNRLITTDLNQDDILKPLSALGKKSQHLETNYTIH